MTLMKHLKKRPGIAKLGILTAIAALGLVAVPSASAYPTHYSRSASCGPGAMIASPPPYRMDTWYGRGWETVKWSPDLYKWKRHRWRLVDGTQPWLASEVDQYGRLSAWRYPNNFQASTGGLRFPASGQLSSGYYAVKEYYYWASSGVKLVHWSYFNDNGSSTICQIP